MTAMMRSRMHCACRVVAIASVAWTTGLARGHGVTVGHSAAGQLVVHVEVPQPAQLPPSIYPGVVGWAAAEPGIASADLDEPDEDLFRLSEACSVQFELIGMDAGVQIVTTHPWVPGETFVFGPPVFDDHLLFNIPNGPIGAAYSLQFRLHDLNGVYTNSDVVTLQFTASNSVCSCRADMDGDGARTGRDIQSFVHCVTSSEEGEPLAAECQCADMDGDGALDEVDISDFVAHLLADEPCH